MAFPNFELKVVCLRDLRLEKVLFSIKWILKPLIKLKLGPERNSLVSDAV